MWEIRTPTTTITLFGTIHTLPANVSWFGPALAARIDHADQLELETIIPDDPAALAPVILKLARAPEAVPLAQRLPLRLLPKLAALTARLRLPQLDGVQTWFAAVALSSAQDQALGYDPARGAEQVLTARARLAGKPIEGLETPEEQLTIFHDLAEADQRALLAEAVGDADDEAPELKAIVADWLAGRTDALAALVNRDFAATPNIRAALLTARNLRWAAWIAERLQRPGSVVIAVGAGASGRSR